MSALDVSSSTSPGRWVSLMGTLGAGFGLVGFLIGMVQPVNPNRSLPDTALSDAVEESSGPIQLVPDYANIDSTVHGANRDWSSDVNKLKQNLPQLFDSVVRTPAMKDEALRDRMRTRAFDGAPPTIPHAVEQQSATSCLVCHGKGMILSGRIATKISHPHFTSCTQCHVEQTGTVPRVHVLTGRHGKMAIDRTDPRIPSGNGFAGMQRSGPGTRLMPGAPPSIPHTTQLRNDCLSCHGLVARAGIRTTHPWLQNCIQCHVVNSDIPDHPSLAAMENDPSENRRSP